MELGAADSQERINKTYMMPLQIYKQQEVQVEVQVGPVKGSAGQDSDSSRSSDHRAPNAARPTVQSKISFLEDSSDRERDGVVTTIAGGSH